MELRVEVEDPPPAQDGTEALQKLLHRRKAKLQVRERDRRRLRGQQAQRLRQPLRLLRSKLPFTPRRQWCGADPEEAIAVGLQPLRQPGGRLLRAPVFGEAPRQFLRRLLGLELGELSLLLWEECARLQLQQRGYEDEELAAGLQIELVPLGQALDKTDDDSR